jgi:predicted MPP superfamily phosphohydrolase
MKLRYLHISDLHLGYRDMRGSDWAARALGQDIVVGSMLESIQNLVKKGESPDFIILTGDITRAGQREEYDVALEFCNQLLEVTGVPGSRFYPVPGNHDVDRDEVRNLHIRSYYSFESQDEIAEILADPDAFPIIMRKFSEFNAFAEKAMNRRQFDEATYHMVESLHLEKEGSRFRVNIAGLNSALFAGYDGDDKQRLALGLSQVDRALKQLDDQALFSILFFHHPFPAFHKVDSICQTRLKQKADLILTGHLHKPDSAVIRDFAGKAIVIGAGASFESRESRNSFNMVEIDLISGDGRVQFYKYLHEHHLWKKDTDANPKEDDGHFPFVINAIRDNPIEPHKPKAQVHHYDSGQAVPEKHMVQARFIHDYLLPDTFTGRADEQARLINLIIGKPDSQTKKTASIITVRALGGTGKSCLIRKVVEEFRGESRFEYIIWFSFYESRTEDEAYMFRTILENLNSAGLPEPNELNQDEQNQRKTSSLRTHLCRYLDKHQVLLVFDGLEVVQETEYPAAPRYGHIKSAYGELSKLMAHLCNQNCSAAIVTSRVSLNEFAGVSGYLEIPLERFTPEAGAEFLNRLGVEGSHDELLYCVQILGGHPLCLKAAGKYMQIRHIPAKDMAKITGDPAVFARSTEGERVSRIVDKYQSELTKDQKYFLEMLSLHPRSITEKNFPALVQDYKNTDYKNRVKANPSRASAQASNWILENIIDPLLQKDLIEQLKDAGNIISYSAHPLMKLAFAAWMKPDDKHQAHKRWAEAAKASPDISYSARFANSLEELQAYLDIVDHYLEGNDPKGAWEVYEGRMVDKRLHSLGHAHRLMEYGRRFEDALEGGEWKPGSEALMYLYAFMGQGFNALNQHKEMLQYVEKQFGSAEATGNKGIILINGAVLSESFMNIGQVHKAKEKLAQIKEISSKVKDGYSKDAYQTVIAKSELFSGIYSKAIELMKNEPKYANKHNLILHNYFFAEALIREGRLPEAEAELKAALELAEKQNIRSLIPGILHYFTLLFLKQNDLFRAREYNDRGIALKKSLNLPYEDDEFLLVAEGHYDRAIQQAMSYVSVDGDEKIDKNNEIHNLIVLAYAWRGKGDFGKAKEMLERAEELMEQTGCWRERDRLERWKDYSGS